MIFNFAFPIIRFPELHDNLHQTGLPAAPDCEAGGPRPVHAEFARSEAAIAPGQPAAFDHSVAGRSHRPVGSGEEELALRVEREAAHCQAVVRVDVGYAFVTIRVKKYDSYSVLKRTDRTVSSNNDCC